MGVRQTHGPNEAVNNCFAGDCHYRRLCAEQSDDGGCLFFFFVVFFHQCCLIHQALLVLINVVLICILNACSHLRIGMIRETHLLF